MAEEREERRLSDERLAEVLGGALQEYIPDQRALEYVHALLLDFLRARPEFRDATMQVWNATLTRERKAVKELKDVGDTLLCHLGLHPEAVERQQHGAPGTPWYTAIGASSYSLAAKLSDEVGSFTHYRELFEHLGEEFLRFVNAVQLARASMDHSASGELRLLLLKEQELPLPTQRATGFYFAGIPYTAEGKVIIEPRKEGKKRMH